jgi:hypothetical protein
MQKEFERLIEHEERKAISESGRYLSMANEIIEENEATSEELAKDGISFDQICLSDIAQTLRGLMLMKGAELDIQERMILLAAQEDDE